MTDAAKQPLEPIPQTSSASKSVSTTIAVNPADDTPATCDTLNPTNK
jgi:hypothetical protein